MNDGASGGARRALLIGIDRYANLPLPLHGCVNDARALAAVLRDRFGFPPEETTVLLDEEATRDGILAALDALAERTGPEDLVVVAYSGHGSQMTDREGDEPDGRDETIVPHDSGRSPHPNRDITDDELYERLMRLSGTTPYVTMIFDCCHSGTVTRDAFGPGTRWVPPDDRPVEELPPSMVDFALAARATRDMGPSGWLPLGERYVLIAGCEDGESSYEHTVAQADGTAVTHGAMTYFLLQELARAAPGTTYRDVFEAAGAQVTATKPRQHPQMEGAGDREVFGVQDVEPVRYLRVGPRMGRSVTLLGGLAHGVTVGSRWAIHAPGTKVPTDGSRLGLVEVRAVGPVEAEADPVEEVSPDAIIEGARALEESRDLGEMRLRVQVEAGSGEDSAAGLRELLERSPLLRLVGAGEPAQARVYLVGPRESAGPQDPVPQLGAVVEPVWAVVGEDGLLSMPVHRVAEPDATSTVVENLETAAKYRHALELRNPDPADALRGKVALVLKRRGADGVWIDAEPDPGGRVVYEDGDAFALEIVNGHTEPLHVSVLDFGLAGGIDLLYPIAGASEALAPGRSASTGIREGDEIQLVIPDGFAALPDPLDSAREEGTETFKLIATTAPTDFSVFLQEGFRDAFVAASPAEELFGLALTGAATRDVSRDVSRPTRTPAGTLWTTMERSITLRRRAG